MYVREHYQGAIGRVLCKLGIPPPTSRQPIIFHRDTELVTALRYTAWYCHRVDTVKHYRNKLYFGALRKLGPAGSKLSHIDIGCGSGSFSWAFLDWAAAWECDFHQISLFGVDRCPAMIQAAQMIRDEMMQSLTLYPPLHYHSDVKSLLSDLKTNLHPHSDSVITMGYVLIQSQTSNDIKDFTEVIAQVRKLTDPTRRCFLAVVDASTQPDALQRGWDLLLESFSDSKIPYAPHDIPYRSFKLAVL